MKNINIIAALIAFAISIFFLLSVLTPPSYFNALPFAIHQAFFKEVTSDGEVFNTIEESTFIKVFDIIIALLIFWLVYALSKRILGIRRKNPA